MMTLIRGPEGPQGIQGPAGPEGPVGPVGPPAKLFTISLISGSDVDTISKELTDINTIRFDIDNGFNVNNISDGSVIISGKGTFKTWKVKGQADIEANGVDAIELIEGSGVSLKTNVESEVKSIEVSVKDYISKAEVENVSKNLQSQLDSSTIAISAATHTIQVTNTVTESVLYPVMVKSSGSLKTPYIRSSSPSFAFDSIQNILLLNAISVQKGVDTSQAFGPGALQSNSGACNTATGYRTLYNNTTGYNNTAIGSNSLFANTIGYGNTATGFQSLYSNVGGIFNVATGNDALLNNNSGNYNTSSGYQSLYSNTNGHNNTAVGYKSLSNNQSGSNNTAVGWQSGIFGDNSNTVVIGDNISADTNNQCKIKYISGSTSSSGVPVIVNSNNVVGTTTSSAAYKKDIETLSDEYADKILKVRPVFYRSRCKSDPSNWSWYGVISEEVAEIDPRFAIWDYSRSDYEVVSEKIKDANGSVRTIKHEKLKEGSVKKPVAVDYGRFVPHLINIVKRQQESIQKLENRLDLLEQK